jgi:hypothetical protein
MSWFLVDYDARLEIGPFPSESAAAGAKRYVDALAKDPVTDVQLPLCDNYRLVEKLARRILVIGDRCWGVADTVAGARQKARAIGGAGALDAHVVYDVPHGTVVDGMGSLVWKGLDHDAPREIDRVMTKKLKRKYKRNS